MRVLLVIVAIATVALGLAGGASPASRATASGKYSSLTDYTSTKGNTEILELRYLGALTGTCVDHGSVVFLKSGSFHGRGTELCGNAVLGGVPGGFTASYSYSGSGTKYTGKLTFVQGFGKLKRLAGGGTFQGNVATNSNSYDYSYTR